MVAVAAIGIWPAVIPDRPLLEGVAQAPAPFRYVEELHVPVQRLITSLLAAIDGTPVLVVFLRMPVARLESKVLLMPLTVVAPPVDVLVASPVRALNVPLPPDTVQADPSRQVTPLMIVKLACCACADGKRASKAPRGRSQNFLMRIVRKMD